jgi:hypothetical protein
VGSDGNECQYQVGLSIKQDGTCTFSGYYGNRGDVWWGTAPPQSFVVSFVVLDAANNGYGFSYGGQVPSAPQSGWVAQWDYTVNCPLIAANWDAIVAKNCGMTHWHNSYSESIWGVLITWGADAWSWYQQNKGTIDPIIGWLSAVFTGGAGAGATPAIGITAPVLPPEAPIAATAVGGTPGLIAAQ